MKCFEPLAIQRGHASPEFRDGHRSLDVSQSH